VAIAQRYEALGASFAVGAHGETSAIFMTTASAGCREDSNRKNRIEPRETAWPTSLLFVISLKPASAIPLRVLLQGERLSPNDRLDESQPLCFLDK
jgi:hypothetical protein